MITGEVLRQTASTAAAMLVASAALVMVSKTDWPGGVRFLATFGLLAGYTLVLVYILGGSAEIVALVDGHAVSVGNKATAVPSIASARLTECTEEAKLASDTVGWRNAGLNRQEIIETETADVPAPTARTMASIVEFVYNNPQLKYDEAARQVFDQCRAAIWARERLLPH